MLKKILTSRVFRILVSVVLIYFAFKKVNVVNLGKELMGMDWWFVIFTVFLSLLGIFLVSWRWSFLLIKKPKWSDIKVFTRSSLTGSFYSLFFPTSAVGDLLKWVIIDEKYPEFSKSKLLGSVILDRFIGMSMFVSAGFVMLVLGKVDGNIIPFWVWLIFVALVLICLIFYIGIYFWDLSKSKIWNAKIFAKIKDVSELVGKDNRKSILRAILLSVFSEVLWIWQMWFVNWYFKAGISLINIFIFIPIISMILGLPISFAGFGAREQLYLLFFTKLATSSENILLTSTYAGILTVIVALIGGLVSLSPDFKKSRGVK